MTGRPLPSLLLALPQLARRVEDQKAKETVLDFLGSEDARLAIETLRVNFRVYDVVVGSVHWVFVMEGL